MAAKITKKPNKTVKGLGAPTRGSGNRIMSAKWKIPSAMSKESSEARATDLIISWIVTVNNKRKTLTGTKGINTTSSSLNLNNFSIGKVDYNRAEFYPNKAKYLTAVTVKVAGTNSKGTGKAVSQTRKFDLPRKPTIDEITFNESTGICSATIKTNPGEDYKERYDTRYRVTVVNTRTGEENVTSDGSSTSTEFEVTYDASGYQNLDPELGEYIHVKVEAWARGYAGDSAVVTRNFYVAYPSKVTIEDVHVSSKDSTGKLTAKVNTNKSTEHPIDSVSLEYLANVDYEFAADIPARETWEDSDIEDNEDCTALTMPVGDLIPDRGKFTWIRVKSVHANEAVLYRYSEYVRVEDLETPAATQVSDEMVIISAVPGDDGKSAIVQLGWNASGTDDSTGTELTWSDEEDTWKSTEDPSAHEFTWSDGRYPQTGDIQYHDSAQIIIKGLTEGVKYYIKARRFYEGETTSYGRYSETATVITNEKPEAVVANSDSYVTEGEPLAVNWTFSGNGLQTSWFIEDSHGTTVLDGQGGIGAAQISWKRISELAVNNAITFRVWVSTGSSSKESEWRTVSIRKKPTLAVTAPTTLTAQPYSFTATSSRPCDLIVIVTSQGASGQFPQGSRVQVSGDTIHSDVYAPEWENGSATVTLPAELDFWDLGDYTLSVVAVDRETGLKSDESDGLASFGVNWAHKAADPDESVMVVPIDVFTDGDEHLQGAQIELTAPSESRDTDVYDIYRMDGDNAHLIGEGFPLNYKFIDRYAPFGDNVYYRIALRTSDGDVEFAEKEYVLESDTLRFDWSGGTLELPYGLAIGDSYKKSVEFRQHMDGSVDGYWNPNIERKGAYSSAVIKLIQPDEINLARALARYPGPVFVRAKTGSAFSADVQVTDLSAKNEAVTLVTFDATEVALTDEYRLPSPYAIEEE